VLDKTITRINSKIYQFDWRTIFKNGRL